MSIIRSSWTRVLQLSQTKRNVIANLFGNGWAALIQLLAIPVYVTLLGDQAYGLYAFYFTISSFLQVFDFGFSPTINRELARFTAATDKDVETRTLTRTMELIYFMIGIVLGIGLAVATPFLANDWLKTTLDAVIVQQALLLMALLVIAQWPLTFYQGGINGLQKQTQLVALQTTMSTLKHGGGILLLLAVPNILALLAWFILVTAMQSILSALLLWKNMPRSKMKTLPHLSSLKPVKHFATGAALTAIAGVPLLMTAPILLSGTVPLSEYGFYTIATIYAGVIAMLYMPIFTAIYPRLTALVESRDAQVAMNFYKFSSQFMALMVIPIGFALAIYAFPLIYFWQRDIARATAIAPIAAIYVFGYILSGLNHIPLALQFAHGNTKLNLTLTVILGLLQIPLLILAIRTNGVTGAAYIFLMINVLLIILSVTLTNKVVIHFGALKWLTSNVLIPFFVAGLVFLVSALVTSTPVPNFINTIVTLSVTTLAAFFFTTTSLSMIRSWLSTKFL